MRANRVDRDQTENDDKITVTFDPFLDQQVGYSFSVNGYGVQGDSVLKGNTGPGGGGGLPAQVGGRAAAAPAAVTGSQGDIAWNVLFVSAGLLVEDSWTAEMAIPLKSLRCPRAAAASHTGGDFRSSARSRRTTRPSIGRRCRTTSSGICVRWA